MKSKSLWLWPLTLLAGCAGPIATRSGFTGTPIFPGATFALAPVPEGAGSTAEAARAAVAKALGRHGYRLAADAPLWIEVALAEREAEVDVRPLSGAVLSPAKSQRALQDCRDRTHRLTLVAYDPARQGVTRSFAEEHHCKGLLAVSLPVLADQAVTALAAAVPERLTTRAGKD